jgi:hypothetical protein
VVVISPDDAMTQLVAAGVNGRDEGIYIGCLVDKEGAVSLTDGPSLIPPFLNDIDLLLFILAHIRAE